MGALSPPSTDNLEMWKEQCRMLRKFAAKNVNFVFFSKTDYSIAMNVDCWKYVRTWTCQQQQNGYMSVHSIYIGTPQLSTGMRINHGPYKYIEKEWNPLTMSKWIYFNQKLINDYTKIGDDRTEGVAQTCLQSRYYILEQREHFISVINSGTDCCRPIQTRRSQSLYIAKKIEHSSTNMHHFKDPPISIGSLMPPELRMAIAANVHDWLSVCRPT